MSKKNKKKSDINSMSISEYFTLILGVIKDIRVIITVVLMIFAIEVAKYITSYRKKPPKPKPQKAAKAPPPPKEEKPAENAEGGEEAAE